LPAESIVARWQERGGSQVTALAFALQQVRGLSALVAADSTWEHLTRLVARTGGDSWLARDWPDGFEPLMLCAPLCKFVDFECARCRVGRSQAGRSCVNPDSAFGRVGVLLAEGNRGSLSAYLTQLEAKLVDLAAE
jgi:hypothetical protein